MIINVSKIWSTRDPQEWLTLSATVIFTLLSLLQLFFISQIQLVGIEAFVGHEASYPLFYAKEILESGSLYPENFSGREIAPVSWPIFNAFLLALGFTVSASTLGISAFCFTVVLLISGFVFSRQFTRSKLIISATLCLLLHSNPYPFQSYSWFDQVFIWPMNSYGVYDVLSIIVLSMSFWVLEKKGGDKTRWGSLFLLITFLVSLNGTRAIVLIVIPSIFSIFYLNYTQNKLDLKKYRKDSLILFLTFLSMMTGMILTKIVVGQYPQPWQEGHSIISIPSSRELIERASLFYEHFVENVGVSIPAFSKFYSLEFLAFLSNLALFSCLTFFVITVPLDQLDNRSALTVLHHRFIFAVLLISIVFGSGWKESRYLIPFFYCLFFAAPIYLVNICKKTSGLTKLFVFSCLFLSCVANTHYLNKTFQKRNLVKAEEFKNVASFLNDQNVTDGYVGALGSGGFVINLLGRGQIFAAPIEYDQNAMSNKLKPHDHADQDWFLKKSTGKKFILWREPTNDIKDHLLEISQASKKVGGWDVFILSKDVEWGIPLMLLGPHSLKKVERQFIRESNILNSTGFDGADFQKTNFIGFQIFGSYISNDADQGSIVLRLSKDEEFLFKSGSSVENSTLSISRSNNIIVSGQAPKCLNWCIINREKLAQQYNLSPKSLESLLTITIGDFGIDTGQWLSILVKN